MEDGKDAFTGAAAIEGFLFNGAGLTGTIEAELEDAACDGTGGIGFIIGDTQCGWAYCVRFILKRSSVMPSIHLWTFSCSSLMCV